MSNIYFIVSTDQPRLFRFPAWCFHEKQFKWSLYLYLYYIYAPTGKLLLYSWQIHDSTELLLLPWEHPESLPCQKNQKNGSREKPGMSWGFYWIQTPKSYSYCEIIFHRVLVQCRKCLAGTALHLQGLGSPFCDLQFSTETEIWERSPQTQCIMHGFHLCSGIPSFCQHSGLTSHCYLQETGPAFIPAALGQVAKKRLLGRGSCPAVEPHSPDWSQGSRTSAPVSLWSKSPDRGAVPTGSSGNGRTTGHRGHPCCWLLKYRVSEIISPSETDSIRAAQFGSSGASAAQDGWGLLNFLLKVRNCSFISSKRRNHLTT